MNIVFINQFDPMGDRVGGIGNYVLSFIRYAPSEVTFKVIGVTDSLELYQWHEIQLFEKRVLFMPIVRIGDINKKDFIPLSIRFSIGLHKIKKQIEAKDILFCQRNEYVFPLYTISNRIITIIHNDLSLHLDPTKSENGWAKAPWLYIYLQRIAFTR